MRCGFTHRYAGLPERFHVAQYPVAAPDPRCVVFNRPVAELLGLDADALESNAAALFSGNALPEDARPIATAYAGHQFGHFVPRLGDGRALLLGEIPCPDGVQRDLQFKGSGRTPFSRGGDGFAALGPMLREYLISEAMHALGIPTTRSLAVVSTGAAVQRDGPLPGAVLTRVAASHVRVGSFEYFGSRGDTEGLRLLLEHVVARHYPEAAEADNPALSVLDSVAERQARLIAQWMQVGFIHGVMNTDNMSIPGETIDYGPCAFMDGFDPRTVFSSIDHKGRYAYANQPVVAQWNLARLAESLLPLIDPVPETAVQKALQVIEPFIDRFDVQYLAGLRRKIGLHSEEGGDRDLIKALLDLMRDAQADHTLTFRELSDAAGDVASEPALRLRFATAPGFDDWMAAWHSRLARDPQSARERSLGMRRVNPAFLPRNHRVEAALDAASKEGDFLPFERLLRVVQHPFDDQPGNSEYRKPPAPGERVLQTFCGT
ncbi:MAG: hypothetical protein RLZZ200_1796 [Pseudomonadota bacterium]|jgi:uncharacterized protein YdiU (UPF0061 family)